MKTQEFQFKHLRLIACPLSQDIEGYVPDCLYEIRVSVGSKKEVIFLRWVKTLSQMEYGFLHD